MSLSNWIADPDYDMHAVRMPSTTHTNIRKLWT